MTGGDSIPETNTASGVVAVEAKTEPVSIMDQLAALVEKRKTVGVTTLEEIRISQLKKQAKAMKRARNRHQKAMETLYIAPHRRRVNKLMFQVRAIKQALDPKDFAMLKDIFKVVTQPEVKDENGVVSQKEQSFVNWQGLVPEGRNVIAVQRQERIKAGVRKRSTGRSSDRSAHSSSMSHVYRRNEKA